MSRLKMHVPFSSPQLTSDKVDDRAMLIRPNGVYHVRRGQDEANGKHGDEYFIKR
jgi:hypothetical protein